MGMRQACLGLGFFSALLLARGLGVAQTAQTGLSQAATPSGSSKTATAATGTGVPASAEPGTAQPASPPAPTFGPLAPVPPSERRNVILVLIDGVRMREVMGRSIDDNGKPVRASELLPNLTALRKAGVFFSRFQISNPAGVSLPGYGDIFAGRRQEKLLSNTPPTADLRSHYPTVFQGLRKQLNLGFDGVALIASWSPLCSIAVLPPVAAADDFFRSCGFKNSAVLPPVPGQGTEGSGPASPPPSPQDAGQATLPSGGLVAQPSYFKPEIYGGSRADSDTFLEALSELPRRKPRFAVIQWVDADEEAHLQRRVQRRVAQSYGIFHYHQALRASDYYLGRLWALLQSDPHYRGTTYLLVTTDHGRDDYPEPEQWALHGHCVSEFGSRRLCPGCSRIFALAVGPGLKPQTVKKVYDHTSLAPSVAQLLGTTLPGVTGAVMPELLPPQ
ncbi:MAG: sulfatase-like hydrolase/transferase [Myxococcales bacterium]|nr:sulfatase-like hydrolase/transferase [Myxococcales bacterium]